MTSKKSLALLLSVTVKELEILARGPRHEGAAVGATEHEGATVSACT